MLDRPSAGIVRGRRRYCIGVHARRVRSREVWYGALVGGLDQPALCVCRRFFVPVLLGFVAALAADAAATVDKPR